jgi:hypothetical protein
MEGALEVDARLHGALRIDARPLIQALAMTRKS